MLSLNDPIWKTFEGGYRYPYDASLLLRQLQNATQDYEIKSVIDEFWQELHHQGDVGLASYMSVPHLIRIVNEKQLNDLDIINLICTIEVQRHKNNPPLPAEYISDYENSLQELIKFPLQDINENWNLENSAILLTAIALSKGQTKLACAIFYMDREDVIDEFLENY
jgi:hypothetical protein